MPDIVIYIIGFVFGCVVTNLRMRIKIDGYLEYFITKNGKYVFRFNFNKNPNSIFKENKEFRIKSIYREDLEFGPDYREKINSFNEGGDDNEQ